MQEIVKRRKTPLAAHLMRVVSVEATADPRSVRKVLLGEAVAPLTRQRVLRALEARGLLHLVPDVESASHE
jgi:hypothetical protein